MSAFAAYLISLSPSLYWPLDSIDGATDQSGNGRDGTGQGGISIGGYGDGPPIIGATDTSTDLDGGDDRITSTYAVFSVGSTRTFIGWAYRDASSTYDAILGGDGSASPYFQLDQNGNTVRWQAQPAPPETWVDAWPGNGVWVFWALTFNDGADSAALALDGAAFSSQEALSTYSGLAGNFQIGADGISNPFDGKLAQVAVFERELSDQEFAALYDYAINGAGPSPAYPASSEPFPSASGFYPTTGGEVAPTVTTGAASDVSYSSATLNGTVDPNGLQTHYWFEYGLTTAYGSSTPELSVGNGTDPVAVEAGVSLEFWRLYYYRLVARSVVGTTYGNVMTFRTLMSPESTGVLRVPE